MNSNQGTGIQVCALDINITYYVGGGLYQVSTSTIGIACD